MTAQIQKIHTTQKPKSINQGKLGTYLTYIILILGVSMNLMPFIWLILGSFKTATELVQIPPTFWPENPTLENYRTILTDPNLPLLRFYGNSTFVAVINVVTTLFTSSLLGFIFRKI